MLLSCDVSQALNKGVGKVVRKKLRRIVSVEEIQFGTMDERGKSYVLNV